MTTLSRCACVLLLMFFQAAMPPLIAVEAKSVNTFDSSYGRITVGRPKIWRFDRVHATLDGLLRDVDAVKLAKLSDLDPNAPNQTVLDFLSTSLNIRGGFNQNAGIRESLNANLIRTQYQGELQRYQAFLRRHAEAEQLGVELRKQLSQAQDEKDKLDLTSFSFDYENAKKEKQIKTLTDKLKEFDSVLKESPPSLTAIPKESPTETNGLSLKDLPSFTPSPIGDDAKKAIANASSSSSIPATKKLDNFITLLHERLSRELSISFDDVAREKEIYLIQFDLSINSFKDSANRVARVEFALADDQAKNEPLAYDLYPGASSYNMNEYWGKSRGTGIAGTASFLAGFGLSAEYKRQRDQIRSAVTQNIYMAGYGAGTSTFGWYIGPSPFEKTITDGNRTAYAVLVLDKSCQRDGRVITVKPVVRWSKRDRAPKDGDPKDAAFPMTPFDLRLPSSEIEITSLAYQTRYLYNANDDKIAGNQDKELFATLQIVFKEIIDPNLVLTINGTILPRLRDDRGRATDTAKTPDASSSAESKISQFGLLETEEKDKSHWLTLGAKSILLKISKDILEDEVFPQIRLLHNSDRDDDGTDLLSILRDKHNWTLHVNDWRFNANDVCGESEEPCNELTASALTPLFSSVQSGPSITAWHDQGKIKIAIDSKADKTFASLDENTQVVALLEKDHHHIPLKCTSGDYLTCLAPKKCLKNSSCIQDISVETPGKYGKLRGFVARKSLAQKLLMSVYAYEVSEVRSLDRLSGWIVHMKIMEPAKKKQALTLKHNGKELLPVIGKPLLATAGKPQISYQILSVDSMHQDRRLSIRLPASELPTIMESPLSLVSEDDQVDLDKISDMLLPRVTKMEYLGDWVLLRGSNLGIVKQVQLSGCENNGRNCAIRSGIGNRILSFKIPKGVDGVYPIRFNLGNDVLVDAFGENGEALSAQIKEQKSLGGELTHSKSDKAGVSSPSAKTETSGNKTGPQSAETGNTNGSPEQSSGRITIRSVMKDLQLGGQLSSEQLDQIRRTKKPNAQ